MASCVTIWRSRSPKAYGFWEATKVSCKAGTVFTWDDLEGLAEMKFDVMSGLL